MTNSTQTAPQEPPALPPHLLRALLNTTPPSQASFLRPISDD